MYLLWFVELLHALYPLYSIIVTQSAMVRFRTELVNHTVLSASNSPTLLYCSQTAYAICINYCTMVGIDNLLQVKTIWKDCNTIIVWCGKSICFIYIYMYKYELIELFFNIRYQLVFNIASHGFCSHDRMHTFYDIHICTHSKMNPT